MGEAMTEELKPLTADWPRDPANGYLLCSPERPRPKDAHGQWAHTNVSKEESYNGAHDHCTCKDCGATWTDYYDDNNDY